MAEPVLGKDAILQIKKNDVWGNYACAINVEIAFEMETKSVKTIGDGVWEKPRGQKKSYQINLSGLQKFDDDALPHAYDLYAYYDSMVSVEFRMIFTDSDNNIRVFEGLVLPVSLNLGGGSEGFASGSAVLKGDGAPTISTVVDNCEAQITDGVMEAVGANNGFRINALSGGPVTRYDWAVDGGGRSAAFVDGTLPEVFSLGSSWPTGTDSFHTLTVWPICEDGNDGEPFEIVFSAADIA